MVHPNLAERIRNLEAQGYTRRDIRKIVGCRNTTIARVLGIVRERGLSAGYIRKGRRVPTKQTTPHPDPDGVPEWCSGCGHLVVKPCLKCFLVEKGLARQ